MFLMAWVAASADKILVHFKDAVGRESTVGVYTLPGAAGPTATGPQAIITGLAGVSDAVVHKAELLKYAVEDAPAAPVADPYDRPTDKLEVLAAGEDGTIATIKLPSLKEAYYQADKQTPLATPGPAKTLLDLIVANCVTADGAPLVITKARRMIPRRLRTWNKRGTI